MLDTTQERIRNRLFRRRRAYRALFQDADGQLNPQGQIVIAHLTKFCRGLEGTMQVSPLTGTADPFATALAEGRREVLLLIFRELKVDLNMAALAVQMENDI